MNNLFTGSASATRGTLSKGRVILPLLLTVTTVVSMSGVFILPQTALAATAGPNSVTSTANCVNDSSSGDSGSSFDWVSPGNVRVSDGSRATVSLDDNGNSHFIKCTGFGFAINAGAVIDGIVVTVERSDDHVSGGPGSESPIEDDVVRLIKGGSVQGSDLASHSNWTTTDTPEDYGSASSLWGSSWAATDVNATNFGVAFSARKSGNSGGSVQARVDQITITVTYHVPVAPHTINASAGAGGTITPSGAVSVNDGASQSFTIAPIAGSIVADTAVDSVSKGLMNAWNFTNVTADHAIAASFDGGWNQPSASANSGVSNASNAFSSNNQYAVFDSQSDQADYRDFGFGIPAGATIDGIRVALEGNRPSPRTLDVSLSWNGGASWTSGSGTGVKNTGSLFSASDKTAILGGSTDTWNRTWASGDFSNSNFRIRLDAVSSGPGDTANIDQVQVKVHYTSGPTTGTLTIVKHVVNDNGGTAAASNWTMDVTADSPSQNHFAGSEAGVSVTLNAGAYSVDESGGPSGYAKSLSADCSGSISGGQTKTCTITNDDIAPILMLEKVVVGGSTSASAWTLTATGPTTFSGLGEDSTDGDVFSPTTLQQGTYTLSESGPSGYTASAWSCTRGGVQNGDQITLGLGETAYCTITNTKLGSITLTKYADPDGQFTINVSGPNGYSNDEGMSNGSVATQPGLEAGQYTVSETVLPDGWEGNQDITCSGGQWQVSDTDGSVSFTLATSEDASCILNNTQYGVIAGQKFNDMTSDGVRNEGDTGLAGWTVNLYRHYALASLSVSEVPSEWTLVDTRATDSNGYYAFGNLTPGEYRVCEVSQSGWTQSYPVEGVQCSEGTLGYDVTLSAGQTIDSVNFGNWEHGSISGMKFNDLDGDSLGPNEEDEEPGIAGWTIELYQQGEGWQLVSSQQTSEDGSFSFTGLQPGVTYQVREAMQEGWRNTMPNGQGQYEPLLMTSGWAIRKMDFGNQLVAVDSPNAIPGSGKYDVAQSIMLTASASTIRYTIGDGSNAEPTCSTGELYTDQIAVTQDSAIRAVACVGSVASPVANFHYMIGPRQSGGGSFFPEVLGESTSDEGQTGGGATFPTSTASTTGAVLGESTSTPTLTEPSCGAYLNSYLWYGKKNDGREVTKLQTFLNEKEGNELPVTGYFGVLTREAVKAFQVKYAADILTPWGETKPTGNVFKTTKWKINTLWCSTLGEPAPIVP